MTTQRKARNWREVRADAIRRGRITEKGVAEAGERRAEFVRAYRLAEIRKRTDLLQADIADTLGISQAMVSKLERGDIQHTQIGTLYAYVAALGGELEVVATFGDETLKIR